MDVGVLIADGLAAGFCEFTALVAVAFAAVVCVAAADVCGVGGDGGGGGGVSDVPTLSSKDFCLAEIADMMLEMLERLGPVGCDIWLVDRGRAAGVGCFGVILGSPFGVGKRLATTRCQSRLLYEYVVDAAERH